MSTSMSNEMKLGIIMKLIIIIKKTPQSSCNLTLNHIYIYI